MPLPIALAFQAQNDPEGSTWYSDGVFECASKPAIKSDTPNGRTPLRNATREMFSGQPIGDLQEKAARRSVKLTRSALPSA